MIIEFRKHDYAVHYQAWFIAGVFVILSVSASIYEVAMHLEYYSRPRLQIRVIRILWMVPIYAIDSWMSLRFKEARFYIDPIRECYEAFVIYNFYCYLVAYLEDEFGDIIAYYSTKADVPHVWPVDRFLLPWRAGEEFFWETKRGVLSYVVARPLMTAVSVLANIAGVYHEGVFRWNTIYPYVTFINNCSQMWALYCLVLLYRATHSELAPIRPLSKFVVIKAVVFFSFWQSVAIDAAADFGLIHPAEYSTYDADDVASGLQNFLICIEMFLAALAHAYAFPPRDYMDPAHPPAGFVNNIRVMFDVRDVVTDVQGVVSDTLAETTTNFTNAGWRTLANAREVGVKALARGAKPFTGGGGSSNGSALGGERSSVSNSKGNGGNSGRGRSGASYETEEERERVLLLSP